MKAFAAFSPTTPPFNRTNVEVNHVEVKKNVDVIFWGFSISPNVFVIVLL